MNNKPFNPVPVLEAAGIDDFRVDYQSKTVFLPQRHLIRLARLWNVEMISAYFFDFEDWVFVDEALSEAG